jgi:hypothetical protein
MYKLNAKLTVKSSHKFHPNKVGYFQLLGGENQDVIVLGEKPYNYTEKRRTYFAVGIGDVQ